MKEPNYVFVKGEGWVPRVEPEPEPLPAAYTDNKTYWHQYNTDYYVQAVRYYTANTVNNTNYYVIDDWLPILEPPPAPRHLNTERVAEAVRTRYFPGSNQRAEARPAQETERERMIRQYRERIQRRGGRP